MDEKEFKGGGGKAKTSGHRLCGSESLGGKLTVNKVIISRLFESFNELERAIVSAKQTLENKSEPPKDILARIASYEDILDKQRSLATALCGHSSLGNWDEVARHIKLINGLSAMIRDDAREILSGSRPAVEEVEERILC